MNFRKLLSMGSQTAPKVIDDLVDPTKALIKKGAMEADEIVGEATKRSANVMDDIMDAELVQKANKANMDPRLAALLGGAGLGAAGIAMMSGDEPPVDPPMAKRIEDEEQPEEFPYDEMDAGAQAEALSMPQDVSQKAKIGLQDPGLRAASEALDRGMASLPKDNSEVMDELSLLQSAQDRDAQDRLMAGLLRAGTTIGSSLAMVKPDYSGVDAIEKNVGTNEKNVKSQIASKADLQKINQAQLQIDDENKLRDPNSDASKTVKQILSRFGVNVRTAKEAKDLGINVQNILLQEMASADRKEIAAMKLTEDQKKKENKLSDDQKKFARDLRKEATAGVLGKQYATFSTGQRMETALSDFAKNPSGYKDYATLMGGLKSLQGDESVVREAEVRLGMSATSLFDSLQNQLQKAATGKMLQPSQRKQMIDTIKTLTEVSKTQYLQSVQPILEQADREGIDRNLILPGSLQGNQAPDSKSEQKPSVKLGSQKKPGSIITTKSGKTYRVNADGLTATEQ